MSSYTRGMVCAAHPHAAAAGIEVLQRGGNAIDAAIAVSFALTVVEPHASGLGGGGFWTIYLPQAQAGGRAVFLDCRECAPRAATPDHYYTPANTFDELTLSGPLAVAVPGMPAGLAYAAEHFGHLAPTAMAPLIEPARRAAETGVTVTPKMAEQLAAYYDLLCRFPATARLFTTPAGPLPAGALLRQPDLARTLAHIQTAGLRTFRDGAMAAQIAQYMAATGGLVTQDDLAQYQPRQRALIQGSYRGYTLWTAPPPSAGGVRLLQVLSIMEQFPVHDWGPQSVDTIHLIAEALKYAYVVSDRYIADPATTPAIPLPALLDKDRAIARARRLSLAQAGPFPPGEGQAGSDAGCTTHFSIIDQWGNIVSATQTLGLFWGSGMAVPEAGLLLNGEMNDFAADPAHLNAVAAGKIPRSNMCPTIVCKDNRPWLILGSPGSERIPSAVLQTLSNLIDHGMDVTAAVAAPRMHGQQGILHLEGGIAPEVAAQLQQRGHTVQRYARKERYFGGVHAIHIDPQSGALTGAADPRRDGVALGY
jgi:gamma-glutamyltranspeptidase/glutathione hydrolase